MPRGSVYSSASFKVVILKPTIYSDFTDAQLPGGGAFISLKFLNITTVDFHIRDNINGPCRILKFQVFAFNCTSLV